MPWNSWLCCKNESQPASAAARIDLHSLQQYKTRLLCLLTVILHRGQEAADKVREPRYNEKC